MDLIIPTMWKIQGFPQVLERYAGSADVDRIIVIDNDPASKPEFSCPKVEMVSFGRNIYVNPAWNEGYLRSSSDLIGILNDDIEVAPEILGAVANLDFSGIDILGFNLKPTQESFQLERLSIAPGVPIGAQSYGFGICMFLPRAKYRVIPSLYAVWFGDDWLCHGYDNVYRLESCRVTGTISGTIRSESKNLELQRRIELDTANAHSHLLKLGKIP